MSVRTYNPSVRVGNWNEDIQLEEVSFCYKFLTKVQVEYGGLQLLYRPMKKKVKGEGWLTGLSRYNE